MNNFVYATILIFVFTLTCYNEKASAINCSDPFLSIFGSKKSLDGQDAPVKLVYGELIGHNHWLKSNGYRDVYKNYVVEIIGREISISFGESNSKTREIISKASDLEAIVTPESRIALRSKNLGITIYENEIVADRNAFVTAQIAGKYDFKSRPDLNPLNKSQAPPLTGQTSGPPPIPAKNPYFNEYDPSIYIQFESLQPYYDNGSLSLPGQLI